MKKKLLIGSALVSTVVIVFGVARVAWEGRSGQNQTANTDPMLAEKCNNALAYMTFPSGDEADEFLKKCLAGEDVLPEQITN